MKAGPVGEGMSGDFRAIAWMKPELKLKSSRAWSSGTGAKQALYVRRTVWLQTWAGSNWLDRWGLTCACALVWARVTLPHSAWEEGRDTRLRENQVPMKHAPHSSWAEVKYSR